MKITADTPEASLGGLQANAFQLTNSAKIIDIVINKMYTNKPGAVIRELAANAWDAHCAKGNPETPFEIHLPTWLEKTFMIRDYGCGIPHDRFENIYTNIGGSTKDDSDDFIGGFGLGSKTPFTMVDSFTVENWHDDIKTTWLCFKSAGNPKVTKLNEEPSTEPSGVKVSFVFEDNEVQEFTNQITKQLRYFPVKPKITGGEGVIKWDELPDGWETKDYFYTTVTGQYNWQHQHNVVMGNVCYELDRNMLDSKFNYLFSKSLTLKVPIGAVDIPPSRENIEYTTKTKAYLNEMLGRIKKQYNDEFLAELKDVKSYLDLRKKFYSANSNLINIREYKYKDVDYTWNELSRSQLDSRDTSLSINTINISYKNVFRVTNVSMANVVAGLNLYINDLGVGAIAHINQEYNKILNDCSGAVYIVNPSKGTKATRQALFDADFKRAEEFFGIKPKLLSKVIGAVPVKTQGTTTRAKPDQIFKITGVGHNIKQCVTVVRDIPTEGYMIPMSGWDAEGDFKGKIGALGHFVDKYDAPIYLVRKHTRKHVNIKNEAELQKHLDTVLTPVIETYQKSEQLGNLLNSSHMQYLRELEWKEVDPILYLITAYHKRLVKFQASRVDQTRASKLVSKQPDAKAFISKRAQELLDKYNKTYKGLMESLSYGWRTKENFKSLHTFLQENK